MNRFVRCIDNTPFYQGPGSSCPLIGQVYKAVDDVDHYYIQLEGFSGFWDKDCFVSIQEGYCPCNMKLCISSHRFDEKSR